jgi:hypothetical protein
MRTEGQITTPMFSAVQQDLDLEATRLERRMQTA